MIFRRCRARPQFRVALAVLGFLYLFAAAADFLAPYPEGAETSHQEYLHLHEARQERIKIIKDSRNVGQ